MLNGIPGYYRRISCARSVGHRVTPENWNARKCASQLRDCPLAERLAKASRHSPGSPTTTRKSPTGNGNGYSNSILSPRADERMGRVVAPPHSPAPTTGARRATEQALLFNHACIYNHAGLQRGPCKLNSQPASAMPASAGFSPTPEPGRRVTPAGRKPCWAGYRQANTAHKHTHTHTYIHT
ncbi:hypothetical protein BT67DRAFT_149466 [Trichocladium antarcticum]|uniref:Uncharacterized protein n=1 Tax=Trichocladium antarcticum TaxID=1450529 RepID=A0AAN6UEY0_9PEZI|nr:hypothetical protein BT67DRAFT_149466 [Trichocladium antarcticum]